MRFYEGEEARQKTSVSSAVAAYEWPAGSSHPAKLAQWILNSVIERGVRLWTHCPVTNITPAEMLEKGRWDLHTPRGVVCADTVVHCTNAYSVFLLPQLANFVTPNRAQAHSLVPSSAFSGDKAMTITMSLRYSLHHFYSLIQRRNDGTLILGVSRSNPELSAETLAQRESFDDSGFNGEIIEDAMRQWKKLFPSNEGEGVKERHGEGLDHAWTGVIGMTPDSVPCVGAVEGAEGQWICAGFNGHGEPRIARCNWLVCWRRICLADDYRYGPDLHVRTRSGETHNREVMGRHRIAGMLHVQQGAVGEGAAQEGEGERMVRCSTFRRRI